MPVVAQEVEGRSTNGSSATYGAPMGQDSHPTASSELGIRTVDEVIRTVGEVVQAIDEVVRTARPVV